MILINWHFQCKSEFAIKVVNTVYDICTSLFNLCFASLAVQF